jgi:hypothetical protein
MKLREFICWLCGHQWSAWTKYDDTRRFNGGQWKPIVQRQCWRCADVEES